MATFGATSRGNRANFNSKIWSHCLDIAIIILHHRNYLLQQWVQIDSYYQVERLQGRCRHEGGALRVRHLRPGDGGDLDGPQAPLRAAARLRQIKASPEVRLLL